MAWGVPKIGSIATVASGNLTLTEPAGVVQGDLMVACIAIRSTVGFANADWQKLEGQLTGDSDATNGIASGEMWACRRGASAPSLVFTRTGGDVGHGVIIAYEGAKGTTLADCLGNTASQTLASANATANAPTIDTTEANQLIVAMAALGDNGTVNTFDAATDPTNISSGTDTTTAPTAGQWFRRFTAGTGTGADTTIGVGDGVRATAGTVGLVSMASTITARHVGIVAAFKMSGDQTVALGAGPVATGEFTAPTVRIDVSLVLATLLATGGLGTPTVVTEAPQDVVVSVGPGVRVITPEFAVVVIPTGQVATGELTAPTVRTDVSHTLSTQLATGQIGDVTVTTGGDQTVVPVGQEATGQFGTPSVRLDATHTLSTQLATGQLGDVVVAVGPVVIPDGQSASGQLGTPSVLLSPTITLSGQSGTGSVGSVIVDTGTNNQDVLLRVGSLARIVSSSFSTSVDATVGVSGVSGTGQLGSVAVQVPGGNDVIIVVGSGTRVNAPSFAVAGTVVSLTGLSASGAVGSVVVHTGLLTAVPVTGVVSTGSIAADLIEQDLWFTPDGVQTQGQIGAVGVVGQVNTVVGVASQRAISAIGSVAVKLDVQFTPTGVQASGVVGSVVVTATTPQVTVGIEGVATIGQLGTPSASSSNTTAISGVQGQCQLGTVAVSGSLAYQLSGVQASGQVGSPTLITDLTLAVAGLQADGFSGNVFIDISSPALVSVMGVQATGQIGAVDAIVHSAPTLIGVQAVGFVGDPTVVPALAVLISGEQSACQIGTVTAVGDVTVVLSGQETSGQLGNPSIAANENISLTLIGLAALGQLGTAVASFDGLVVLEGVQGSGFVGVLTAAVDVTPEIFSVAATGEVGSVNLEIVELVVGVQAVGQLGPAAVVTVDVVSIVISGVAGQGFIGSATVVVDCTVPVVGQQASGQLGSVGISVPGQQLLIGVQATGQVGSIAVQLSPTVLLTGVQTVGQLGNVQGINGQLITPSGLEATGQIGTVDTLASLAIEGVQAVGQLGTVLATTGVIVDVTVGLTGVSAQGQIGTANQANVERLDGVSVEGAVGSLTVTTLSTESSIIGLPGFPIEAKCFVGEVVVIIGGEPAGNWRCIPVIDRVWVCVEGDIDRFYGCVDTKPVVAELGGVEATGQVGALVVSTTEIYEIDLVANVNAGPSYSAGISVRLSGLNPAGSYRVSLRHDDPYVSWSRGPDTLILSDDLDYPDDAAAIAAGWTVVTSPNGTASWSTVDTEGQAHVFRGTVVDGGNAYLRRTFPATPGQVYRLEARGRIDTTRGFDTGGRVEFEPGPDSHPQSSSWTDESVQYNVGSATTVSIDLGRKGGYFGISGTYWCQVRQVRLYGPPVTKWETDFMIRRVNVGTDIQVGSSTDQFLTAQEAFDNFTPVTISGDSVYDFWLMDSPITDNLEGLSLLIERIA